MTKKAIVKYSYSPRVPIGDLRTMRGLTEWGKEKFQQAIPEGAACTAEGIMQGAMLAVSKSPKLLLCTQASIYETVLTSCRLGLDCSGVLGSAYMVPYKNQCKLIIGYPGLADLARRASGAIRIDAQVVYEGDKIDVELGTDAHVHHTPDLNAERRPEKIIGAYAVVQVSKDAPPIIEWMPIAEVNRIRARSPACDSGPWRTDKGEMVRKTPFRRVLKRVPVSVVEAGRVLAQAIEHDNITDGVTGGEPDVTPADRTKAIESKIINGKESNATDC